MTETRGKYNAGFKLSEVVDQMPPGLERAMLRVLSARRGREMAISREDLVAALRSLGFRVHERQARACINQLRKDGQMICSTGGADSGYWLASSWEELEEYLEREVHSRAMDLLEQEQALRKSGELAWGPAGKQIKLFD